MMKENISGDVAVQAEAVGNGEIPASVRIGHTYKFEAYDRHGNLKWVEEVHNTVVNEGLDEILDKFYTGSAYTAAHYVALTGGTPSVAAGDTMSSHVGWTEVTAYGGDRPSFTPGTVSGQSVDNDASKASFAINANGTTIGGAVLTTDNTKGGTAGILIGGAAFSAGDKSLDNGDTLNVTVTATASSA